MYTVGGAITCQLPLLVCSIPFNRRLEEEDVVAILNDDQWTSYKKSCSRFSYELDLAVEKHIFFIASPKAISEEEKTAIHEAGCNPLIFHAAKKEIITEDNKKLDVLEKQIIMIRETEQLKVNREETYQFGGTEFAFNNIAMAYDAADVDFHRDTINGNNTGDSAFDIVKNNCADFILEIGNLLGIKNSIEMNQFVVKQLMSKFGSELVNMIRRGSNNINFLLQTNNMAAHSSKDEEASLDDEELVQLLVASRTSRLMEAN